GGPGDPARKLALAIGKAAQQRPPQGQLLPGADRGGDARLGRQALRSLAADALPEQAHAAVFVGAVAGRARQLLSDRLAPAALQRQLIRIHDRERVEAQLLAGELHAVERELVDVARLDRARARMDARTQLVEARTGLQQAAVLAAIIEQDG